MQFETTFSSATSIKTDCLVVAVFGVELSTSAKQLDEVCQGALSKIIKNENFKGNVGQTLLLHHLPNISAKRILLVGCGEKEKLNEFHFNKTLQATNAVLKPLTLNHVTSCLTEIPLENHNTAWKTRQIGLLASELGYKFYEYKTDKEKLTLPLEVFAIHVPETEHAATEKVMHQLRATVAGMSFAKDLANQPGNICTPTFLAEKAITLAQEYPAISTEVLEVSDMEKLGMGALLAVGQGSRQPAKLIVMNYTGAAEEQAPVVLVGKGITFDTGGISLKPAGNMDEMKYDMCGAASVFGTLRAVAELQLPINVVGIVPSAENMPGSYAYKPGDIVKTMSGQTVEIINTDAEGRLILCDALTYAERFKPAVVLDMATLTGAIVVALGTVPTGYFTENEELAKSIPAAANETFDRVWRMPLWEDYQSKLDSPFADMTNCGDREGGSITAACFLARFTKKYKWAHLDIAGTAYRGNKEKGATGRPIPLLVEFLLNHS